MKDYTHIFGSNYFNSFILPLRLCGTVPFGIHQCVLITGILLENDPTAPSRAICWTSRKLPKQQDCGEWQRKVPYMHPFSFPVRSLIHTIFFSLRYVQQLTFYNYDLKVLIFLKSLTFDNFESSYSKQGSCRILSFGLLLSLFGDGERQIA